MLLAITDFNLAAKEFQKDEYCYKNHTRVASKSDSSLSNTAIQEFTPDLNSIIDIIEQGVINEHLCVPIDISMQVYGYDQNNRNYQRFLKSKLTKKYSKQLLFVTVEQNKPVMIIIRASLERQLVPNVFFDKTIILKKPAVILQEKVTTFVEKAPDVYWPPTVDKLSKDSRKLSENILNFYQDVIPLKILNR